MEWLSPLAGAIAAAVAVPALVALYFLKLKRREELVSSTLLWKRAVQDLQVNAPLRMIRHNILLILQLLALAALLVAMARPAVHVSAAAGNRYVILVDRSASMNSTDVAPSRLAEAQRQAKVVVDSLRAGQGWSSAAENDQAMVMTFDVAAKVLCNYTADKNQLKAAIESITPTDCPTNLAEAVSVARAFATAATVEENNRSAETPARLEVFSDGRIADLDQVAVGRGELTYHAIGRAAENLGLVALQVARSSERPERVEVFANVANYGPAPAATDVQLSLGGNVRAVRPLDVPGAAAGRAGQAAVSFTLENPEAGIVEARLLKGDLLADDNAAWSILQPPKQLNVLLVTPGNVPLESALRSCPLGRLDVKTPDDFDRLDHETMSVARPYNLIVLDRHEPAKLAACNYLVFGRPPPVLGIAIKGELKGQFVIDWRSRHPVLNYVNLGNLYVSKCWQLDLPRDAIVLAEFDGGPALAVLRRPSGTFLLAPFNLLESNWPFEAGFVMFCYNVTSFLGSDLGESQAAMLKVGQPISVQTAPGQKEGRLSGPGLDGERVTSDAAGKFRYPRTFRAGVYRLAVAGAAEQAFAVNLLDEAESRIAPADQLTVSGQAVQAQRTEVTLSNRELWPLLAALGLLVVLVEWWVYNAKVRI